jgi:hypothetical protein
MKLLRKPQQKIMVGMADGMAVWQTEWSNGGNGGNGRTAERMAEWQNGGRNSQMADRMAEQREWRTEWSNGGNGRMAGMADGMVKWQTEMATYVLFTVHTDNTNDDNDDTLIFCSVEDFLIMDCDSIDSGQDCHRLVGGDPEPDLLSELQQGSHGGSHPGERASAQVSIQSRGTFCLPSIVEGGSDGSCLIIPVGNYFDDTITQRSHWMVSAWNVFCPKGKCGDQGSRDYSWHHLAATAAIPELFGAAKHFRTKNADSELSYK